MSEETTAFQPFNNIGLCFSGGGYRATFYALGVVSYLNEITYKDRPLLESVKALSTVSGGTLLGVAYARAVQDPNFDFKAFFQAFYTPFLPDNDTLLKHAVAKLSDDAVWKAHPHKKRSLINAFALTYAEMPVFQGDFECFHPNHIRQLREVCFNSTDFSFGMTYRFQNNGYFGNNPLYRNNQREVNALRYKVQLGDVVASSSCFPLGFEPLVFPDDYFADQQSQDYKNLKGLELFIDGVGIMDGGIADNQGIGSMMLISQRSGNGLDLIMVNDVGSYKMQPWQPDTTDIDKRSTVKTVINRFLRYFTIKPVYLIVFLIGLATVIVNSFFQFKDHSWTAPYIIGSVLMGIGLTLTLLGGVAWVIKNGVLARIRTIFRKNVPEALIDDILTFQKLDISLVQRMISERLSSAAKMINDVFLKQMRRLNYDLFYSKEALENRRLTATIYKLNGQASPYSESAINRDILPHPSSSLMSVSLTASEMATTLWWSKEDIAKNRMDCLIACGQFTVCYELMDYILKLRAADAIPESDKDAVDALYKSLENDWKHFNKSPLWLVEKLKR